MNSYKLDKYKYFDILILINNFYLKEKDQKFNLRVKNINDIILYNFLIENFFIQCSIEKNIDKIIEYSLNLCGYLWFKQPFYDGNTRTLKKFLQLFFSTSHYSLTISRNDLIIPCFCNDNDFCTYDDIIKLKRLLKKQKRIPR